MIWILADEREHTDALVIEDDLKTAGGLERAHTLAIAATLRDCNCTGDCI